MIYDGLEACPTMMHSFNDPSLHPGVRGLQATNRLFCRIYHGLTLQTRCPLPRRGPGILISNHTSGLDPLLLQSATPRLITWMMAREYYEIGAMGWIFRLSGMIPTSRNGRDMAAMRSALRVLKQGGLLGVFPEGRIETTRELLPFHPGVAMLAMRCGVPVYPAYLDGMQRGRSMLQACLLPGHAGVRFGEPIELPACEPTREVLRQTAMRLRSAVQSLQSAQTENFNTT
jgi:1-acyl-sn-glycerol-3-phosphate acyltransferase